MSYVLDGIKTAYEVGKTFGGLRSGSCPCGWKFALPGDPLHPHFLGEVHMAHADLRFHYQNCIQARIPDVEREDTTFACRHGVIYSAHCDECMAEDVDSEA